MPKELRSIESKNTENFSKFIYWAASGKMMV
jgi:hypothetical protein